MNTIYSNQSTDSLYRLYAKNNIQTINNNEEQTNITEHIEKDPIELSKIELQALNNSMQGVTNINTTASSALDSLVAAGTITQDQANAVANIFQSGRQAMQAPRTYNNRPSSPLSSLVSSGIITQEQEKSIQSAFQSAMKSGQAQNDTSSKYSGTTVLDGLVSSGTITQDQENSIESAFESIMKPSAPPQEQTNTQTDKSSNPFVDILDSLVSAGTITQDQEDSIQSAFESTMKEI